MEKIKAIDTQFGFSRARDGMHLALHQRLENCFTPEWTARYNVTHLRDQYIGWIQKEKEVHFRRRYYEETAQIAAAKAQCDASFLYISQLIRTQTRNPNPEMQEAAKRLMFVLGPYKKVRWETLPSAHASYEKFLTVMGEEERQADIARLDLLPVLVQLEAALEDFSESYRARGRAKLERETMTLREIRPQVDASFRTLATLVNALYYVNYYVDQDGDKETELQTLIDEVNSVLVDTTDALVRAGLAYKPVSKRKEKASAEEDEAEKEVTL